MGDPHFHFYGKLMIRESPFLFNFKLLNHTSFGTDPEKLLWVTSVLFILLSFILFDRVNYFTLAASLIGATSLIFSANGIPLGSS